MKEKGDVPIGCILKQKVTKLQSRQKVTEPKSNGRKITTFGMMLHNLKFVHKSTF